MLLFYLFNCCFEEHELHELRCEKALVELFNADIFCSDNNSLDSVCVFECSHEFTEVGSALSACIQTEE